MNRNRLKYFIVIIIVITAGLASRKFRNSLPVFIGDYSGDVLWALMVFLVIGFLFKGVSTWKAVLAALVFSYSIEISQLYHAPWIDSIRSTTLGGLILGFGFLWSDIICYTVGILLGTLLD
ncbi:MAG: DUF2809 domain-containing protein, partial [Bacillota bacterium]|nr:DUF2809 domain-containing protein [Bacillota bacterium]